MVNARHATAKIRSVSVPFVRYKIEYVEIRPLVNPNFRFTAGGGLVEGDFVEVWRSVRKSLISLVEVGGGLVEVEVSYSIGRFAPFALARSVAHALDGPLNAVPGPSVVLRTTAASGGL
jgi:hypothetical protein